MCIIIAKEKHGRLPKEEELKNSFEYNSDGAGFMYVDNGKVVIDKGYMKYETFIKHYKKLLQKYNNFKNKSLVIHCRIGTSGKNIKGNTHPYPITNNTNLLRKTFYKTDIGIVHNGIIRGYGTAKGLNDTQEFISKFLYPLYNHYKDFYKNEDIMESLEIITTSKLAILNNKDELYLVGDFISDKDLLFSNDSYKDFIYYTRNYKMYDSYWDDFYKKEEEDKEEYLIPLESSWYIDRYGNGNPEIIGSRDYWYNCETLELCEYKDGDFEVISKHPIIYDENLEEFY